MNRINNNDPLYGIKCPHCHGGQVGGIQDQTYQEVYRYRCARYRKSFTDLTGTMFEYSQATLLEWFLCIYLVSLKCPTLQISASDFGLDLTGWIPTVAGDGQWAKKRLSP